jgi:hypothetical protein
MNRIIFFILCLFLIGFTFAQTTPKPKTIKKENVRIHRYNGKIVTEKQLLDSLNRDYIKFCDSLKNTKKL